MEEERQKKKPKPEPRTASEIFLGFAYEGLVKAKKLLDNPETEKAGKKKLDEALDYLKIILEMAAPQQEDESTEDYRKRKYSKPWHDTSNEQTHPSC